ncbi:MAG TPA: hypothetical protein VMR52_12060 [Dehalococcoidia bacterium]|nr:hypothetical protein [Dehalococcoidia bacterium]
MIDLEELRRVVDNADVFTIGFRMFPERLIIDTRSTDETPPMVRVVEPVTSVEERFFWLGRERPQFAVPERFTFFVWPHSLRYFEDSGLGDMIRQRVCPVSEACEDEVRRSIHQLRVLERRAEHDAISGRNYQTLWERSDN